MSQRSRARLSRPHSDALSGTAPAKPVPLGHAPEGADLAERLPPAAVLPVTPAPVVSSVLCGLQFQSVDRVRGFRPGGTKDWLMVSALSGQGYCRAGDGCWTLGRGDVLLIAPDTPQEYGYLDDDSNWVNIWAHFRPRPHWLPWLVWPQLSKGMMLLRTGDDFPAIEAELRMMVEASNQPRRLWQDHVLNCLERVIIHCDDLNPLQSTSRMDRRIRRALEIVGERLALPLGVEELSQAVGLSRSRFTVLFAEQTNMSPQAYIEFVRLSRAAQMLQMSSWSVGRIAEEVGIPNPFYFSTRFRQRFGVPPSVYRDRHGASGSTPHSV